MGKGSQLVSVWELEVSVDVDSSVIVSVGVGDGIRVSVEVIVGTIISVGFGEGVKVSVEGGEGYRSRSVLALGSASRSGLVISRVLGQGRRGRTRSGSARASGSQSKLVKG